MNENPTVSVLMSVYNGEKYLAESVTSILNQTFRDFELIIIDDYSGDRTPNIIRDFSDTRIKIVRNDRNLGLIESLNKGLIASRGRYIGRMDADDLAIPQRLEREVQVLNRDGNTALTGSWVEVIDQSDNTIGVWRYPVEKHMISWKLMFHNVFTHSATMYRKDRVMQLGGYDRNFPYAEDYDLWSKLSYNWNVVNIPEILVKWRRWGKGVSQVQRARQVETGAKISKRNMERVIGEKISPRQHQILRAFYFNEQDDGDKINKADIINAIVQFKNRFVKMHNLKRNEAKNIEKAIYKKALQMLTKKENKYEIVKIVFALMRAKYENFKNRRFC